MGRTFRQRKRNSARRTTSLSSDPNFIRLTRWMHSKGWIEASPLVLAKFSNTGRGLMAKKFIKEGDILVSIPDSLLITTATVATSTVGHYLRSKETHFNCQEVLATFLVWERHFKNSSKWNDYIQTLPRDFSVPHTVDLNHFQSFPWFLQDQALCALELAKNSFSNVTAFFDGRPCTHCQRPIQTFFTWESFLWGWCCVNTRAVFIEPGDVPSHHLHIRDRNCLALAPYLDMFNHSDTAQVQVGLNKSNNCYEIKTSKSIKKYSEAFINYGPHANSKLFLEYGFVLPSNPHDIIPLRFSDLTRACKAAEVSIEYEFEKVMFIQKYDLATQLYISSSGLSWNCSTLLKILLSSTNSTKVWEHISFKSCDRSSVSDELKRAAESIFGLVEADLSQSQSQLTNKCDKTCCALLKGEGFHPTIEMCKILLQSLMIVLAAAQRHSL